MIYKKFLPREDLENFIECYYVWESGNSNSEPIEVESPPNAFTSIVFNYADPYMVSNNKGLRTITPMQFIIGQQTYSYKLHLTGKVGMAGIVFKPTGIASLLNISMHSLTGERVDLKVFIKKEIISGVMEKLVFSKSPERRYKVLEDFIIENYIKDCPEQDPIDKAANLIVKEKGKVNINELCENSFMSRRQFERKFLKKVGLSPKYYARLRRIGYICSLMAGKEKVNWQDLYLNNDFYDQSHFIKDFTEFTGRPPEKYFYFNNELVHYLEEG